MKMAGTINDGATRESQNRMTEPATAPAADPASAQAVREIHDEANQMMQNHK